MRAPLKSVLLSLLLVPSAGCELLPLGTDPESAGGLALLSDDGTVQALSSADGSVLWSAFVTTGASQEGSLLSTPGALLAHAGGPEVTALDPDTGEVLWIAGVEDDLIGALAEDGERVFGHSFTRVFGISLGGVHEWTSPMTSLGYSLATGPSALFVGGEPIRTLLPDGGLVRDEYFTGDSDVRALLYTSGRLYAGTRDGLTALQSDGLVELWTLEVGVQVQALDETGSIYAGTNGSGVVAVGSDGLIEWEADPGGVIDALVAADGQVVTNTVGGTLVARDALDGTVRWESSRGGGAAARGLEADGGTVYLATDDILVTLDASSGSSLWKAAPSGTIWAIETL